MKTLRIVLPLAALLMLAPFAPLPTSEAGIRHNCGAWLRTTRKSGWGWGPGYHVNSCPRPNTGVYHQFVETQRKPCQNEVAPTPSYSLEPIPATAEEPRTFTEPATEETAPSLAPATDEAAGISLDAAYYDLGN